MTLIWLFIRTAWIYLSVVGRYFFNRKGASPADIASQTLFENHSFRLPESAYGDVLIIPKTLFRLFILWFKSDEKDGITGTGATLVVDSTSKFLIYREKYLNEIIPGEHLVLIPRDKAVILLTRFPVRALFFVFFCLYTLLLLPFSFSRWRAYFALHLHELSEFIAWLAWSKKEECSNILLFHTFDLTSNLQSYILNLWGIPHTRVLTELPLWFHYRKVVADKLALMHPYNKEEFLVYEKTIFANMLLEWPPEKFFEFNKLYSRPKGEPAYDLAYYSSGGWVRKREGHADPGFGFHETEDRLHKHLRGYCLSRPQCRLVIYPHPIEWMLAKSETELKDYYQKEFEGVEFDLAEKNTITLEECHLSKVAIAIISTTIVYRVMYGFKSLYYYPVENDLIIPHSSLDFLSIKKESEFSSRVTSMLEMPVDEFNAQINWSDWASQYWKN